MKRLHVHVSVKDLDTSIRFYSQLFAAVPTVRKADYARWMLEDPRVNFAISQRDGKPGVQHLGIQVEDRAELEEVYRRLERAEGEREIARTELLLEELEVDDRRVQRKSRIMGLFPFRNEVRRLFREFFFRQSGEGEPGGEDGII